MVKIREVRNGERLSGHGTVKGGYPEISVNDGKGPGGGSMLFTIVSFHWADVVVNENTTELWFENRQRVAIHGGLVQYAEVSSER